MNDKLLFGGLLAVIGVTWLFSSMLMEEGEQKEHWLTRAIILLAVALSVLF